MKTSDNTTDYRHQDPNRNEQEQETMKETANGQGKGQRSPPTKIRIKKEMK
jgi:hypothetical protein